MSELLIIYKDPKEHEVGAVIDLADKNEQPVSTHNKSSWQGRSVAHLDTDAELEKINSLFSSHS